MKLLPAIFGLVVVGLLSHSVARADIPPLPADLPSGKNFNQLEVRVAPSKDISFLRISRSALEEAGLEIRDKKKTGAWTPSTQRSIVAALALSFGIAGVFFARKRRGAALSVALVAAGVVGTMSVQAWGNGAPFFPPTPTISPTPTIQVPPQGNTGNPFGTPNGTSQPAPLDIGKFAPQGALNQLAIADQSEKNEPVKNFNGKVVIEITDDNEGVRLFIGTKPEPKYQRILPPDQRPGSEKGS